MTDRPLIANFSFEPAYEGQSIHSGTGFTMSMHRYSLPLRWLTESFDSACRWHAVTGKARQVNAFGLVILYKFYMHNQLT